MKAKETTLRLEHSGGHTSAILMEPGDDATSIVILGHGFLSNKDSRTNLRLTELLTSKGLSTLRFDWIGMGDSGGRFAEITLSACCTQLNYLINDMKNRGYRDIGLIGSSFGGLVAILVAADHPELFALGLKCPVPDFPEMLECEFGQQGIEEWKRTNTIPNVTGGSEPIALDFAFHEDCCQYNAYEQAAKISTPCVIVHGEQDELVPIHQIHRLVESLPGEKNLRLLPEANHHFGRPEDFRVMSLALTEWIVTHSPSSQSTAKVPS
ncbi:alpha/beta hydrolase [Candidatus Nitronereus thalassa]|uniref:Alpha/beta hydrolase n=1 Tax=Candidatus Nitronereus thalassa TaxID=3020898 RepID=A0ABU3KBW6_9BACT|nr:alpha/beta hydrolase [Candidatus Nitronereus thalassa]MDT7043802.1 alpha/beta hydrolase [Candidatus Nitronereus thalassa]